MSMDYKVWIVVCTRNSFSACDLFQEHLKTRLPKNRVCSFAGRALHLRSSKSLSFVVLFNLFLNYILHVQSLLAVNKRGFTK